MTRIFRIGARASALSMTQTARVQARLGEALDLAPADVDHALPLIPITTSGDRIQDRALLEAGGKGLFTKELDEALLAGRIDLAVHSMKDLPTELPEGIALACIPERLDPRDAFISPKAATLSALSAGAIVGTASLRRQAQTLHARPDLRVALMRGNVETRLRKLEEGQADATYLALAGLARLGLANRAAALIDPIEMPPAPGQGALAVTARADDEEILALLARINDLGAAAETAAERAFLAALEGSCRTPIGAHACIEGDALTFVGEALTPDGARRFRRAGRTMMALDPVGAAQALGARFGAEIRAEAGEAIRL